MVLEQARSGGGGGGGCAVGGAVPTPTASEACWFCLGSSAADLGLVVRGVRLAGGGLRCFSPRTRGERGLLRLVNGGDLGICSS